MAANQPKKNPRVAMDGNAAYWMNTKPKIVELPPQQERVERTPQKRSSSQTRRKFAVRAQQKISVTAVAGFVVAAMLAVGVLTSHIQLASVYADTVAAQNEIEELEEQHAKLQAEYETIFDVETLKEAAETAGLQEATSGQEVYMELTEPDNAVVYQSNEEQTGIKGYVQAVKSFFAGLGTYFS